MHYFWYSKVSPEAAASYLTYSQITISHFVTSHLFLRLTLINVFYPIFLHFLQIQWKGKRKLPKAVDCQFAAPSCNNTRSLANLLPAARLFLIFVAQCNEWWRSLLKKVYLLVSLEVLMFISMVFFADLIDKIYSLKLVEGDNCILWVLKIYVERHQCVIDNLIVWFWQMLKW